MDFRLHQEMTSGTLELLLGNCVLTQRGTNTPIVYKGAGLVSQSENGALRLIIHSEEIPTIEAIGREFAISTPLGQLVPDTAYYDLTATDQYGAKWHADHLSLDMSFGQSSTVAKAEIRALAREDLNVTNASIVSFVPGKFDQLRWVRSGQYFSGQDDRFQWQIVPVEKTGLKFEIQSRDGTPFPIETHDHLLMGMSLLLGQSLSPTVTTKHVGTVHQTVLHTRRKLNIDARLRGPLEVRNCPSSDMNSFITRFLVASAQDGIGPYLYGRWHQLLRVSENDIANSSLILSVAIEAVITKAFRGLVTIDDEWAKQVSKARDALNSLPDESLPSRARARLNKSLETATQKNCSTILAHLEIIDLIEKHHTAAWKALRHRAAHGGDLPSDQQGIQAHLKNYFTCLGLFYKLVAGAIDYRGALVDYSKADWPTAPQVTIGDATA